MKILFGIYALLWIALEGNLLRVALIGLLASLLLTGWLAEKFLGGRRLSATSWLLASTFGGLGLAVAFVSLTLLFMSLKTGLHAHGPEFTVAEIEWLLSGWLRWALAGLLGGAGLGIIILAITGTNRESG